MSGTAIRHYSPAEIEAVLALDERRTPGDYEIDTFPGSGTINCNGDTIADIWNLDDLHFLAAAPHMAAIIRQLQREIDYGDVILRRQQQEIAHWMLQLAALANEQDARRK